MSREIIEVVVTSPADWMPQFVERALSHRLIACAHQIPTQTKYRWSGEVRSGREIRAAMHTVTEALPNLFNQIKEDHPYEVPCVLWHSLHATDAYADWVQESTSQP